MQKPLQPKCGKEGFNVLSGDVPHSKARIGILGNQENNCHTCDSRIGFGTGGKHDDSNTCADNGNKHIKAMVHLGAVRDETRNTGQVHSNKGLEKTG